MQDYIVTYNDGSILEITNAGSVKQVFGFLEFRGPKPQYQPANEERPLIVAVRVDEVHHYAPANVELIQQQLPGFKMTPAKRVR